MKKETTRKSLHKKGFTVAQVFIYIMTLIVFAAILLFGYKAIAGVKCQAEGVACVKFQQRMIADVESVASQYRTVRIREYALPAGTQKVCFVDFTTTFSSGVPANDVEKICTTGFPNYDPIICNSWKDKANNVFSVGQGSCAESCSDINTGQNDKGQPFLRLAPNQGSLCLQAPLGRISLRLEGQGDYTIVTKATP